VSRGIGCPFRHFRPHRSVKTSRNRMGPLKRQVPSIRSSSRTYLNFMPPMGPRFPEAP
jgi:hypothetical protein